MSNLKTARRVECFVCGAFVVVEASDEELGHVLDRAPLRWGEHGGHFRCRSCFRMMGEAPGSGDRLIWQIGRDMQEGRATSADLHRALALRDSQLEPARRALAARLEKYGYLLDDELRLLEEGSLRIEYADGHTRIRWWRSSNRTAGEMRVEGGALPSRLSPDERRRIMQLFAEEPETWGLPDSAICARIASVRDRFAAWQVAFAQEIIWGRPDRLGRSEEEAAAATDAPPRKKAKARGRARVSQRSG